MPIKDLYMNFLSIFIYKSPKLENPKCLITDEWINNLWYVNIIEYSKVKKEKNY